MQSRKQHWEKVYQTKPADAVSWFQEHATRSIEMIHSMGPSAGANIIDVGGGASTLVDDLLAEEFKQVCVLDLSANALAVARRRLGVSGDSVRWIVGDIREVSLPDQAYDIWHDRAVFHFLTDPADRAAYVRQVMKAVRPGGHVIVATFALDGPEQCSGLPVARYSPDQLHGEFGPSIGIRQRKRLRQRSAAPPRAPCPWGGLRIQPQVRKDLLDHRPLQDGGDDLELPGAAVRAALHVDVKHGLAQPCPADACGPALDGLGIALDAGCGLEFHLPCIVELYPLVE